MKILISIKMIFIMDSVKNYNDIIFGLNEVMKNYNNIGKGPYKDEIGFDYYKTKENGIIKYIKDLKIKECEMNIKKMDNNIKLAQADINDMNNMKRVIDEKERINLEKIKRLQNDNLQLDSDVNELKEILDKKKNILKNLKKRNEQTRNNKKKIIDMNNNNNIINNNKSFNNNSNSNVKADIILNESFEGEKKDKNGNINNGQKKEKKQRETGCECNRWVNN